MSEFHSDLTDSGAGDPGIKYNLANGLGQLIGTPPFGFEGVQGRIFPLSANMNRLQNFIEAYLNIAPEIVRFYPAMPIVFLQILDYGMMSAAAQATGFVSQREIVFLVPLLCYRKDRGRMVYQEMVTVAPFIYVDNDSSLRTGREVYGWEKTKVLLNPDVNRWFSRSARKHNLFEVSAMVIPDSAKITSHVSRPVLRIEAEKSLSFSSFPPAYRGLLNPFVQLSTAATSYMGLWRLALQSLTAWRIFGYRPYRGGELAFEQLRQSITGMNVVTDSPRNKVITLKQFRDACDPTAVCYQALVESEMEVSRLNGFGLLNDARTFLGDLSGGYRIGLASYPGFRVAEKLGLNIRNTIDTGEGKIHTLEPILPFWSDLDMNYTKGSTICWRTKDSQWWNSDYQQKDSICKNIQNPFNEVRGSSIQQVAGPYRYTNLRNYILPLKADRKQLCKFIKSSTENPFYHFEAWGDYVYLMVQRFDEVYSATFEVAGGAGTNIEFSIPVKVFKKNCENKGELLDIMLVPAYMFTDNSKDAISQREVLGTPAMKGDISCIPPAWLTPRDQNRTMADFSIEDVPLPGFEGRSERLFEIYSHLPISSYGKKKWKLYVKDWLHRFFSMISSIYYIMLAVMGQGKLGLLKLLGFALMSKTGLNRVFLKQFRDASSPNNACYQSVVLVPSTLDVIRDVREIEESIRVDIYRRKGLPIAETLGLVTKNRELRGGVWVDSFESTRPLYGLIDYTQGNGVELGWRAGSGAWVKSKYEIHTMVDSILAMKENEEIKEKTRTEKQKRDLSEKVVKAVEEIQPQSVIENILNIEWGIFGKAFWMKR